MDLLLDPGTWVALLTLTVLEIVLGVDNIVFISIMAAKLPVAQRESARRLGLLAALVMRLLLLLSISWIAGLTAPLFSIPVVDMPVSGRDLILFVGGLFLIAKATFEIHERLEGDESRQPRGQLTSLQAVVLQIMLLDIVFSLDSVITAIGMANHLAVMVAAVVIAVGVMLFAARPIGEIVERHPSLKMLALAFLLLIGTSLVAESAHVEIPKGYIYFAMGFSVLVELLNIRAKNDAGPVHLRDAYAKERDADSLPGPA